MTTNKTGKQAARAVIMVRPHAFRVNDETAADNRFQAEADASRAEEIRLSALAEHDRVVAQLRDAGVTVHVFDDFGEDDTPDSLFPNNWVSADTKGQVVLYPMYTPNRRRERRGDVVDFLTANYKVAKVTDISANEAEGKILEGTGSMVIDHVNGIAYAAGSQRTDGGLFEEWCRDFGYEPVLFEAKDQDGYPVYHTNVVMGLCEGLVLIGSEMIVGEGERERVLARLRDTGHDIVDLSFSQIENFAGNCLEVSGRDGSLLAISSRAVKALTPDQIAVIEKHLPLLPLDIPTIEMAGGSVRCLMADVHLPD